MNIEQLIEALVVVVILLKLHYIDRANHAMARGKAAEAQNAWHLHDLCAVETRFRANQQTTSEGYDEVVYEIRQTHALIADAYDPNNGTRNIDKFLLEEERRLRKKEPGSVPRQQR